MITKRPKGTQDILPEDSYKWRFLENFLFRQASLYGFDEIRTPVFEHTELFLRSVGEGTDVVEKEMYTFEDKGKRSITLRPEGTAGTVRAVVENGIYNRGLPQKLSYLVNCYRYEKPQTGRYREFNQFGLEIFGAESAAADAEMIAVACSIFKKLNVSDLELQINTIGCPECRKKYYEALLAYFEEHKENLCPTCIDRLETRPMRILDCKDPGCQEISKDAPIILDYLCDDCKEHFETLKEYLHAYKINYMINPRIVRGLDYYTRTVFEFVSNSIGAQGTVCGGGRYNGLVSEIGGPEMQCVGFGMGIERLILLLDSQKKIKVSKDECDIYVGSIGEKGRLKAIEIAEKLRGHAFRVEVDISDKGIKPQMKFANRINAGFSMIIGDNEISNKSIKVKNMRTGTETEFPLSNYFVDEFVEYFEEVAIQMAGEN